MNKESPAADAPAPQDGAEQAATDQTKQQAAPDETGVIDTITSVVDGVTDAAGITADILSIFA